MRPISPLIYTGSNQGSFKAATEATHVEIQYKWMENKSSHFLTACKLRNCEYIQFRAETFVLSDSFVLSDRSTDILPPWQKAI